MTSLKECDRTRGAAELELKKEIWMLRKSCTANSPSARAVGNLVTSMDSAYCHLVNLHVNMVMKIGSELVEARHTQYIKRIQDSWRI